VTSSLAVFEAATGYW